MNPKFEKFVTQLRSLKPESDPVIIDTLFEMVSSINEESDAYLVFPDIFHFLESHPEADLGAPGPLVHFLERHRGLYEELLKESIIRAPMHTTLWMLNRILNAPLDPKIRSDYLEILNITRKNPEIAQIVRSEASRFYEVQETRG